MRKYAVIVLAFILAVSCRQGGKKPAPAPAVRAFPQVEVPYMIQDPAERADYATQHFWDAFLAGNHPTDSLHIAGVPRDDVEKQMGVFATLLEQYVPSPSTAMEAFASRLSENAAAFGPMTEMAEKYFYDPNSPLRSEECWLALAGALAKSPLADDAARGRYAWQAQLCSLNRPGAVATDFPFTDISGRRRTLHSVKAEYLLLIFGNPDCAACKDLVAQMSESPEISALEASGRLKVVDIFIDREVDAWRSKAASYPSNWINGYDHTFAIREDLVYNVRAVPSLYLLDADKRVLFKDATTDAVLSFLAML